MTAAVTTAAAVEGTEVAIWPAWAAAASTAAYAMLFILALRVGTGPDLRLLPRNHEAVIRFRIKRISLFCAFALISCAALLTVVLQRHSQADLPPVHIMLGFGVLPLSKLALVTLFGLGLTVVLFLGPLVQSYLDDDLPFHSFWHDALLVSRGAASLPYLRDYIVAPVAEEIVFRGCMVPIWRHLAQISPSMTIVLLPLIFGLSHFHHVPETRAQLGGRLAPALVRGAFQCIYTTVFGMFATWLMLKTSSVWPCVASHMLCNMMGLPQVGAIFDSERRRLTQFLLMSAHIVGLFLFGFLVARFNTSSDIPNFVN